MHHDVYPNLFVARHDIGYEAMHNNITTIKNMMIIK